MKEKKINKKRTLEKDEIVRNIYYGSSIFFIMLGILIIMSDMYKILPYYIKSTILFLGGISLIILGNYYALKEKEIEGKERERR